ncbi:MAG: hypothetical protein B7Y99_12985 [Caulobacterales bacterium 32-69-10]|nr:MAG: hypothetical protein B7Y99_12985 [Caulobacterales bacterium 32-69-10]
MPIVLTALAALVSLVVLVAATTRPAYAHHGTAQYDFGGDTVLQAVVSEYTFESPHIWLRVRAPDKDGKMAEWSLEGPPPFYAVDHGWTRDSLRPGQRVVVAMAPHKRQAHAGLIISVAEPGGKPFLERGRRY